MAISSAHGGRRRAGTTERSTVPAVGADRQRRRAAIRREVRAAAALFARAVQDKLERDTPRESTSTEGLPRSDRARRGTP